MDVSAARKLVEQQILSRLDGFSIMDSATAEYDFGWLFYYQTDAYIGSGDFRDMAVGHGPVFVDRTMGRIFETGSAYSKEHYIEAYLACGDPLAEPTAKIRISGWNVGANKVATTMYIKEVSGLGLQEAKNIVDKILSGEAATFTVHTPDKASEAVKVIQGYNFICSQLWSNQC